MRKCGNKCLYRRVLAGALSVLLAVGTGACGGKAETGTGQAEVLTQGAEAGTGSAAQSANGSDIAAGRFRTVRQCSVCCASLERYAAGAQHGAFLCEAVFRRLLCWRL